MHKENKQFKIESMNDAIEFISDFKRYARSGSYNVCISDICSEEVMITNAETPFIERSNKMSLSKILLEEDDDTIQHIIETSKFYEEIYNEIMSVYSGIKEAIEELEKIIDPLKREGYDLEGVIRNRIERLKNKNTDKNEAYSLMKETDEMLLERGFRFICMNIYDYEVNREFNYDICPYLNLGEFEKFGLDTRRKTEEFIQGFINSYSEYMNCVWQEEEEEYFEYNIGRLIPVTDLCKLWIEDGFICRQKKRNFYNYEWPIERYQISNQGELSKLADILEPDIRLINYSYAYRTQE